MSRDTDNDFSTYVEVVKADQALGVVMGFAVICTEDGEPYFDVQGDHIPESSMLKAAAEFMENSRLAKEMHTGEDGGTIVFAWPMTTDIAKAFDIETNRTGLMIAMKPSAQDVLDKFISGEYTGFSIGGTRIEDEEID